ncbi:hypothetical protein [Solitalea koreensis]|uniref:Lipocalin-like domain-containing protein n=1 Tax=Solitalea koreensis TaxID=543615 RepID=A0A521EK43_9SPHI|nr:hypothetical protein [Solitalea koreensis]SMO84284.1 hypothetical protein SAMN06265350_11619 [Solitalea koreensis]
MKLISSKTFIAAGLIALTFAACKKDEFKPSSTETVSIAAENATAEDVTTDGFNELNVAAQTNLESGLSMASASSVATETVTPGQECYVWSVTRANTNNGFPKTVTLDFGAGCTKENITRKGKITAVYNAPFYTPGATVTITFDNYSVNDIVINGTKKVTNVTQQGGNFKFEVKVEKIMVKDTVEATWSSTRIYELVRNTANWKESYFKITGSANGVNKKGHAYTATIKEPLIKYFNCPCVSKGTIEVKAGDKTAMIDFGTGVCDRTATVTIGDKTVEIKIKH